MRLPTKFAAPGTTGCNIDLGHCFETPVFLVRSFIVQSDGKPKGFTDLACAAHGAQVLGEMAAGSSFYLSIRAIADPTY